MLSPVELRWFIAFGIVCFASHCGKIILLYAALWRPRPLGRKRPVDALVFMFLCLFLMLLPYQDSKVSKAMNRALLIVTITLYVSWLVLGYLILTSFPILTA